MRGNSIPVESRGTVNYLLWQALGLLPEEKQIRLLTDGLIHSGTPENTEKFLWALERLMREDYIGFRCHLREAYYEHALQDELIAFKPQLEVRVSILRCILEGWTWQDHHRAPNTMVEDAEECFLFLVRMYRRAMSIEEGLKGHIHDSELIKEIEGLFARHLHRGRWHPNELDPWIFRKEVPDELALVLTKLRARLLEGSEAKAEATARGGTHTHNESA